MGERFEEAIRQFVAACDRPDGARRRDLNPASRQNDLVRQTARKRGLVVYEDRGNGKRWFAARTQEEE